MRRYPCPFCRRPVDISRAVHYETGKCPCGARYLVASVYDPSEDAGPEFESGAGRGERRVSQIEADGTAYDVVFY